MSNTPDHEKLRNEVADILAKRHGFDSITDTQPLELMVMLLDDAQAIVEWHLSKLPIVIPEAVELEDLTRDAHNATCATRDA